MYAQLADSYIWNMMNNKKQLDSIIQDVLAHGEEVNFDKMPITYSTLRNRQKSILMPKLTEVVETGDIVMVYCDPYTVRIPVYLPFIILSTGGGPSSVKGLVFLNNCDASKTEDGEYSFDATKLKVSLESCYISLQMFLHRNDSKLQSPQIMRPSVKMYAHTMTECLNRKFSIKLDQDIFNTVMYAVSKYFVTTMMGYSSNESVIDSYCLLACNNPNVTILKQIMGDFDEDDFMNAQTLITALSGHPRLKSRIGKLTVSGFIESYINMYNSSMILSMENYAYFVFNILSVTNRTYVNNYQMLENIVGDDGKKLYASLVTTIC